MISVAEALQLVRRHAAPLAARPLPLVEALGRVLAEEIVSDVDSPPHDKSVVDGYALHAASTEAGTVLEVLEEATAGQVPAREVRPGGATRIMTGAPIPRGADAVVMVERTEPAGEPSSSASEAAASVRILQKPEPGQNIMRQAASMRRGQAILHAGRTLSPIEIGLLAEVGRPSVLCIPRPTVGILATGNELVDASRSPEPGQIRNSNGPMLASLTADCDAQPTSLGIARDTTDELRSAIDRGLACDVLLISGGVSEGVLDLAPRVLTDAGVRKVFHKVHLKPGKPLWFGVRESGAHRTLVFGLPGNPVSSLVCFQLFVRPALALLAGKDDGALPQRPAILASEHRQHGERPTYWPGAWRPSDESGVVSIEPLPWKGSGDLLTLAHADGLIHFPPGTRTFARGEPVTVLHWR